MLVQDVHSIRPNTDAILGAQKSPSYFNIQLIVTYTEDTMPIFPLSSKHFHENQSESLKIWLLARYMFKLTVIAIYMVV